MAGRYAVIRQALSEPELNAKLFASEFGLEAKKHRVLTVEQVGTLIQRRSVLVVITYI